MCSTCPGAGAEQGWKTSSPAYVPSWDPHPVAGESWGHFLPAGAAPSRSAGSRPGGHPGATPRAAPRPPAAPPRFLEASRSFWVCHLLGRAKNHQPAPRGCQGSTARAVHGGHHATLDGSRGQWCQQAPPWPAAAPSLPSSVGTVSSPVPDALKAQGGEHGWDSLGGPRALSSPLWALSCGQVPTLGLAGPHLQLRRRAA